MAGSDLVAPVMLLAMPQVHDPFFRRSVVLLLAHEREGSFGFIVNRATELKVGEIVRDLGIEWGGDPGLRAGFGGPVQPQVGTLLFAGSAAVEADGEETSEVLPGIRLSQNLSQLARLAPDPPGKMRLLLGYSGWGEGQLVSEILRNDWLTLPVDDALIFGAHGDDTWKRALASLGVSPDKLPAWSDDTSEDAPN